MFTIRDNRSMRVCQGATRREFMRVGSLGLGGLTLANLLSADAHARGRDFIRDKSVVLLFLQGGPPQVEMFDPKMDAPAGVRSCTGAVQTKHPGVEFGGTFPKLGRMADRISIVRSFASGDGGHNQLPVLTGNSATEATMGAQFARLAGANHPDTAMPSHTIVLPEQVQPDLKLGEPTGPFSYGYIKKNYPKSGRLGAAFDGVLLDGGEGLTSNLTLNMPRERFDDRRSLLAQLDSLKRKFDKSGSIEGASASEQQAVEVLMRGIADAFDLSKENPRRLPGTTPATYSAWKIGTKAASTTTACVTNRVSQTCSANRC